MSGRMVTIKVLLLFGDLVLKHKHFMGIICFRRASHKKKNAIKRLRFNRNVKISLKIT